MIAPKPTIVAPDKSVASLPIIGCQSCDDHPDFPRTHCGRPGCRDAQAIAYARHTGGDIDQALAAADGSKAVTERPDSLCYTCAMRDICIVGLAVIRTERSLEVKVSSCAAYRP